MTNNYCSNCGNKIGQLGANFCPKCGQNLKTLQKTVQNNIIESNIHDDGDGYSQSNFDKINLDQLKNKIKISVDVDKPKKVTVADVIQSAKNSDPNELEVYSRPTANLPKGKDLLKVIADECSSSREKSLEVE